MSRAVVGAVDRALPKAHYSHWDDLEDHVELEAIRDEEALHVAEEFAAARGAAIKGIAPPPPPMRGPRYGESPS